MRHVALLNDLKAVACAVPSLQEQELRTINARQPVPQGPIAVVAPGGNLAVRALASGGVYLAGGIPPRILPLLSDGRFTCAFVTKGRLSDVLGAMPVKVVLTKALRLDTAPYGLDLPRQAQDDG